MPGSCRLPYELISRSNKDISIDKGYLLSTKDLCGLKYIPDLIRIGVSSLKIEGRMKNPEYVATVTRIYRKYIDLAYSNQEFIIDEQDQKDLLQVFNRGGFTSGHLDQEANKDLIYKDKPNNIGIYIGNVANFNASKGHITLNLNDNLKIGDTISFEQEDTKYRISELMIGRKNIDYAISGQLVTIGRMKGNIHPGDKIYKLDSKTLLSKTKASYSEENKKHALSCYIEIHKNKPIIVNIYDKDNINFKLVSDKIPEVSIKNPIDKERIISQFSKTGNTPFCFENFKIDLDNNLYINIRDLNELRRNCLDKISNTIIQNFERKLPKKLPKNIEFNITKKDTYSKKQISILLNVLDVNNDYSRMEMIDSVYIPLRLFSVSNYSDIINTITSKFNTYIYMPTIIKSNYKNLYTTYIDKALEKYNIKGFVLSNLGNFEFLAKYKDKYEFIGNYTLNVMNTYSLQAYSSFGLSKITLSPELNSEDIITIGRTTALKTELVVYGNIPVMTTGYCFLGNSNKCYPKCKSLCNKNNNYYLKDRLGFYFKILLDNSQTVNTIYNSKITSLDFSNLPISSVRIDILNENIEEINNIIKTVKAEKRFEGQNYTNGNFIRNV